MTNTEKRLLKSFRRSSINSSGCFVADPEKNISFNLFKCNDDTDIKCSVIEHITEACIAGSEFSNRLIEEFNEFLHTDFCLRDLKQIFNVLGGGKDSDLCRLFVISGYNMNFIE